MMTVSINGCLFAESEARLSPLDRGYLLGDGVFETLRIASGKPRHFEQHWQRLQASSRVISLTLPFDKTTLLSAIDDLFGATSIIDGGLRLSVSRGYGPRGLLPSGEEQAQWSMMCFALPKALPPVKLIISPIRRNEYSPLSQIKSLNYLDNILAKKEAVAMKADDALMLNSQGRIASSTTANVFLYKQGKWLTPPLDEGVLPGIIRACFIEYCQSQQQALEITPLCPEDIDKDCSAFICNSLRGIIPVQSIGECQLRLENIPNLQF